MNNVYQLPERPPAGHGRTSSVITQPTPIHRAAYTVAEVAELLGIALGSTYAMVRAGQIPAKRIGARWVISKRRLHTWLDEPEPSTQDIRVSAGTDPS